MSDFQKQARNVVKRAKEMKVELSYQQALELIASINGYKAWAALNVAEKNKTKEKHEAIMKQIIYVRLDYFHGRKDSGSYYCKFNKNEMPDYDMFGIDEEQCIELAIKNGFLDSTDASSISYAEEIDEADFIQSCA